MHVVLLLGWFLSSVSTKPFFSVFLPKPYLSVLDNICILAVKRLFLPIRTKFNDNVEACGKYKSYHLLAMVKVQSSLDETLF